MAAARYPETCVANSDATTRRSMTLSSSVMLVPGGISALYRTGERKPGGGLRGKSLLGSPSIARAELAEFEESEVEEVGGT